MPIGIAKPISANIGPRVPGMATTNTPSFSAADPMTNINAANAMPTRADGISLLPNITFPQDLMGFIGYFNFFQTTLPIAIKSEPQVIINIPIGSCEPTSTAIPLKVTPIPTPSKKIEVSCLIAVTRKTLKRKSPYLFCGDR